MVSYYTTDEHLIGHAQLIHKPGMKRLLFILVFFSLTACNTTAKPLPMSTAKTSTPIPLSLQGTVTPNITKAYTHTPAIQKTITLPATKLSSFTPTVSLPNATATKTNAAIPVTSTQAVTATPTVNNIITLPPLSQIILTSDDFYQLPYSSELGLVLLYLEPHPVEKDVTVELGEYCIKDCAKRIWTYKGFPILTIVLVRTSSESSVQKAVENLSEAYMALGSESYICNLESFRNRNNDYGFAEQTFLATFPDPPNNKATTVLVTSYGSIYILIVNQYGVVFDLDIDMHCASIQFVGKLQVEKLNDAGYTR